MKNIISVILLSTLMLPYKSIAANKSIEINSPDKRITVGIDTAEGLSFSLLIDGKEILTNSKIALDIDDNYANIGSSSSTNGIKVKKVSNGHNKETIKAPFYRVPSFNIVYNFTKIALSNGVSVEFRVFNEGVAYRFETTGMDGKDYKIRNELAGYHFTEDYETYIPYSTNAKKPEAMAFQATYNVAPLSKQPTDNLAFLPLTISCGDSQNPELKITLMESDLENYPGMFVRTNNRSIDGWFSRYPRSFDYYAWRMQKYVTATEDFIALCHDNRTFPWRILSISRKDTEMPMNNLVYALAAPNRIGDTSWIKPGKVSWDWWNDWGLTGVDFSSGINMDTYKYYIDFASAYGLEYIILDEGWYDPKSGDMMTPIADIDLPELIRYGKEKNVRIILWTVFNVLDKDLEAACKKYSNLGIAGFKVDFLDRDDQEGVEMIYRIAEACAKHHLMLDYHGIYKPTGINRTYPNVINFESVFGMEEVKWTKHDEKDMPQYDVTFPFIRMQCGSVDFTPGGMRNATNKDFQPIYYNPLTMGTRCHQLAMYVIHDSPLTMLADSPTSYEAEPDYTRFVASIPTIFDETLILNGKMGEYIVTARRKDNVWYVGGQTNWNSRDLTIDLSPLKLSGDINALIYCDGMNAEKNGCDYKVEQKKLDSGDSLQLHMASGGGFVIKLNSLPKQ